MDISACTSSICQVSLGDDTESDTEQVQAVDLEVDAVDKAPAARQRTSTPICGGGAAEEMRAEENVMELSVNSEDLNEQLLAENPDASSSYAEDIPEFEDRYFEDLGFMPNGEVQANIVENTVPEQIVFVGDDVPNNICSEDQLHLLEVHGYNKLKSANITASVNEPVIATMGEIFQNALALCRYHKWGHREKADLFKFVNSLFKRRVLPDSRYLLDELFYSQNDLHFYFYCCKCTQLLGELNKKERLTLKTMECPNPACKETNNVSNLLESAFFVTFDVPSQLEVMLLDRKFATNIFNVFQHQRVNDFVGDLYSGTSYRKFVSSMRGLLEAGVLLETDKVISFTLAVDGVALFTNSKCSIWPCFLMVNELPLVLRMQNMLIAGLWFGSSKAQMDLYLNPICEHIRKLGDPGFSVTVWNNATWRIKAYLIACCVDSGARGDVQGIHSHRGEFSCNWCEHEGIESNKARKFPFLFPFPEERTAASLLQNAAIAMERNVVVKGVKYSPCIASLPFYDNVEGMIVEWMHAGAEGNAKKFTMEWINGSSKTPYYVGAPVNLAKIEKRIASVKPPVEVRKYLRKASDMAYYTGREWENWLLFFSVPILCGILESRYLRHWVLFVQESHLLLSTTLSVRLLDVCEKLLIEFVAMTQQLYGIKMMRFNVHLLSHLVQNVIRWGCLWSISGFSFEAANQKLKKVILAMNGIPQQICRAISEDKALFLLKNVLNSEASNKFCDGLQEKRIAKVIEVGNVKLIGVSFIAQGNLTPEEVWLCNQNQIDIGNSIVFQKVKKNGIMFSSFRNTRGGRTVRSNNSFSRLSDKRIVRISSFIYSETNNHINVLCQVVRVIPHLCPPSVLRVDPRASFLFKINSIDDDKVLVPVSLLEGIFVYMEFECQFLSPMPNVFNMV